MVVMDYVSIMFISCVFIAFLFVGYEGLSRIVRRNPNSWVGLVCTLFGALAVLCLIFWVGSLL